jgi:hypothetical protein
MDARLALFAFRLVLLRLDALGGELLPDLVRMELARLLLVRLVDVINACRPADFEEVVEGNIRTLVGNKLIANAEDFAVCRASILVSILCDRVQQLDVGNSDMPSFVHAAVSGVNRARRPTEIAENLMMAVPRARKASRVWAAEDNECCVVSV